MQHVVAKVMRNLEDKPEKISCLGALMLHSKNSLSLLCDTRSTAFPNRLKCG